MLVLVLAQHLVLTTRDAVRATQAAWTTPAGHLARMSALAWMASFT
jgi:hypothetical protein